jgi:peptide/nickel transport system permease protein
VTSLAQTKKPRRLLFTLGRFWSFLKRLLHNKKSLFGLVFIALFVFMALGARLLTPYNSLGEIPGEPWFPLSYGNDAPTWLKYFPTWLGGNPDLSQNMRVAQHSGLPSLNEFNFTSSGEGAPYVNGAVDEKVGYPVPVPWGFNQQTENGSFVIKYQREAGATYNETVANLYIQFNWPYSGSPGRFTGNIELLVNGTTGSGGDLDVPVKVEVYAGRVGGREWRLWPSPDVYTLGYHMPIGFVWDTSKPIADPTYGFIVGFQPWGIVKPMSGYNATDGWIICRDSPEERASQIDSESNNLVNQYTEFGMSSLPARMVFTNPGEYVYGLKLTFVDQKDATKNVETTVHVDDFGMLIYGTSFGLLGTDHHGRDLWSQLVYGTAVSLYLGILVAAFSVSIGLAVGLAAGYLGRVVDEVLMRITDVLLVLPGLPLLIVLVAVLGASLNNLILLLGVLGWMGFARLVRSQVLSIKERPFVESAKAIGAGRFHIILNHVLPSVMALVYISLATAVPGAVTAEAALSWLGFFDPNRMSWGRMLYDVFEANAVTNWWWVIPPGLCISMLAASFILLGFALDEVLNPKLRLRK